MSRRHPTPWKVVTSHSRFNYTWVRVLDARGLPVLPMGEFYPSHVAALRHMVRAVNSQAQSKKKARKK